MVDTKVSLSGLVLDNPVIPASGTFGYGSVFSEFYDINILGSFSFKGTTLNPRDGNPCPRIAETKSGMLNSVGLQNPGAEKVAKEELGELSKIYGKKVIANVGGFSVEEYVRCAEIFDGCEQVGLIELNISCPNVPQRRYVFRNRREKRGSRHERRQSRREKARLRKTQPQRHRYNGNCQSVRGRRARTGLSLINTLLGMRIDLKTFKPVLANKRGGLSGGALFPVALRMVYDVYEAVKIPIMGMGGVESAEDVAEMMLAGATAVQVGAANLVNPFACKEIIEDLPRVMKKFGIKKISDIIGGAHR